LLETAFLVTSTYLEENGLISTARLAAMIATPVVAIPASGIRIDRGSNPD